MEGGRILVVDDEESLRFFVSEQLTLAGYTVVTAGGGREALEHLRGAPIDLVLLDLMMADVQGLRVLEEIAKLPDPPVVIILTAHASLDSAINAMRLGSHDYLVKPCRPEELLASVQRGLARRREEQRRRSLLALIEEAAQRLRGAPAPAIPFPAHHQSPAVVEIRGLRLDRAAETVTRAGQPVPLTSTEFRLLVYLIDHAGQVVRYRELASALHNLPGSEWEARQAVSTHLWRLRRKLGDAPDQQPYIIAVRGRGFRFLPPGGPADKPPAA